MSRILCLAALVFPLAAACDRTPAPLVDRSIERGTALPPPGMALRPAR